MRIRMLSALALCTTAACQPHTDTRGTQSDTATIEELRQQLEKQANDLDILRQWTTRHVQDALARVDKKQDAYLGAFFDPSSDIDGYQRIDTSLGRMLISLEDVEPFADGSRITITIGNLTSATLQDAKLRVSWGSKRPDAPGDGAASEALDQYEKSLQAWTQESLSKEHDVLKSIRPGMWTATKINLPKIPPARLDHVRVSMQVNQVRLPTSRD